MGRALTGPPASVSVLLAELARRGIELRAVAGRVQYHPRSAMTPELATRLAAHRGDLLAVLTSLDPLDPMGPLGPMAAVDDEVGPVAILAPADGLSSACDQAARLIRDVRRGGDKDRATALEDAWRERVAVCTMDGELSIRDAETVALDELQSMIAQ